MACGEKCKTVFIGGTNLNCWYADIGLLILRVYFGCVMAFAHGINKIPPGDGFVGMVSGMGFPMPYFFAWMAGLSEFIFALLLAVGFMVRPSAFFIACTMAVAGFIAHSADPFQVKELAFTYLVIAITFIIIGSNRFSVDHCIRQKCGNTNQPVSVNDKTE